MGLKYTRFHTTALCSPTRAALLTGRNHHTAGMGGITESRSPRPATAPLRPETCAPLAEILRLNGYSTAQFGKCHEAPVWGNPGPRGRSLVADRAGFEVLLRLHRRRDQPVSVQHCTRHQRIEPDKTPGEGYHFDERT